MNVDERDIGSHLTPEYAGVATQTAGGAGDNTAVHGSWIDRMPANSPGWLSAFFGLEYTATLAEAATLSAAWILEDADDSSGTNPATLKSVASAVISTGGSGGTTNTGAVGTAASLVGARRYIRASHTPDLSSANTDVSKTGGLLILGGKMEEP